MTERVKLKEAIGKLEGFATEYGEDIFVSLERGRVPRFVVKNGELVIEDGGIPPSSDTPFDTGKPPPIN